MRFVENPLNDRQIARSKPRRFFPDIAVAKQPYNGDDVSFEFSVSSLVDSGQNQPDADFVYWFFRHLSAPMNRVRTQRNE